MSKTNSGAILLCLLFTGCSANYLSILRSTNSSLAFSDQLSSTSSPTSRVFMDSSGATTEIAIGGTCDASAGDVTLSGLGLTSSTSASCTGTFSAIVYYSSGTPSFTSDYGAKQISISQNGGATLNTTLFKAATTHTNVALISTATDLEA